MMGVNVFSWCSTTGIGLLSLVEFMIDGNLCLRIKLVCSCVLEIYCFVVAFAVVMDLFSCHIQRVTAYDSNRFGNHTFHAILDVKAVNV
jgi:hypothetical protein